MINSGDTKRIKAAIMAALLSSTLLSGCGKNLKDKGQFNINDVSYTENVTIPDNYIKQIRLNSNINASDLINLKSITIFTTCSLYNELRWLNYCTNLEKLVICTDNPSLLKDITYLPNLKYFEIVNNSDKHDLLLDNQNLNFLKTAPNLEYIKIGNFNIEKNLIESLNQIKVLDLSANYDSIICNYDFDYQKMHNLDKLIIKNPYSTLIHMGVADIMELYENKIKICTYRDKQEIDITNELLSINKVINKIIDELNINHKEASDLDKLVITLKYIIDTYQYANTIPEEDDETIAQFYNDGYLYGAFKDKEIVCANYAALLSTLIDRFGIDSTIIVKYGHAYNTVNINNQEYMVDATSLDQCIINNKYEECSKYFYTIGENSNNLILLSDFYNNKETKETKNLYRDLTLDSSEIINYKLLFCLIVSCDITFINDYTHYRKKMKEKKLIKYKEFSAKDMW